MPANFFCQFRGQRPASQNHGASRATGTSARQNDQPRATANQEETGEQQEREVQKQQAGVVMPGRKSHGKQKNHQIKNANQQTRSNCGELPAPLETIKTAAQGEQRPN